MKKIRKNTKIGGITALRSVSFMVGWLDGWMVGRLDGWMVGWLDGWMVGWLDTFFFFTLRFQPDHIPELREEKPRSARNKESRDPE